MDYILLEDIQPLIRVPEIKSNKFLELQYKLHSYGFIFWINDRRCKLTDKEKGALSFFRDVDFSFKKFGKLSAPTRVQPFDELNAIAFKMAKQYPSYQKWLLRRIESEKSLLHRHPQWKRYMVLNTPMQDVQIEERIKEMLVATRYRSIHEMLLVNNYFDWRKAIIKSDRDFRRFFAFAKRHNFIDLITR